MISFQHLGRGTVHTDARKFRNHCFQDGSLDSHCHHTVAVMNHLLRWPTSCTAGPLPSIELLVYHVVNRNHTHHQPPLHTLHPLHLSHIKRTVVSMLVESKPMRKSYFLLCFSSQLCDLAVCALVLKLEDWV